ncbi:MAG: Dabb family protein [Lachnospiraceae bacterium]|nr:Dabb family protein [Lachnospiraceae bacterium]
MVYHIVMWNFKEEVKEQERAGLKREMATNLKALVGKVPGLLSVDFIENPVSSSTHDMALLTTFEKVEDIKNYAVHPQHVYVADTYVRPYTCGRACLDYEL